MKGLLTAGLLGLLLLFSGIDVAQANCTPPCTKTQVQTDINTNWPDNTTQQITPALLRSTVLDLVNSYLDVNGQSSFTCPSNQFFTAIASLSTYNCAAVSLAGLTGFGTGVQAALTNNIGSAGAPVLFNGAGGTPTSLALANATGLPFTGLPTGTSDTVLGYWGTTVVGPLAINNCTGALTYSTSTHTFGCNSTAGTGTVTSVNSSGNCSSGTGGQTAFTTAGTIDCRAKNALKNSSLTAWFNGIAVLTIQATCASTNTIANNCWGAEGLFVVPTGASVTTQQVANTLSGALSVFAEKISGNTSVTDVTVRFVIESYDAAPLAGQQVTCQLPVQNNTGGSITPTITVKRANAQDSTYTNTDVSAASLQTITNGSVGVLAYSWAANAASGNGLSIDIDFGNNFSANTKAIIIGGGFDCHVTPAASTGTIANPPTPIIPSAAEDLLWCQRSYATTYANGTAPATATPNGMVAAGVFITSSFGALTSVQFPVQLRAVPTVNFWDSAGTTSKVSSYPSSSNTIANGGTAGFAPFDISTTGFQVQGQTSTSNTSFIHYAADVRLIGG
jgi:hypothetical protein